MIALSSYPVRGFHRPMRRYGTKGVPISMMTDDSGGRRQVFLAARCSPGYLRRLFRVQSFRFILQSDYHESFFASEKNLNADEKAPVSGVSIEADVMSGSPYLVNECNDSTAANAWCALIYIEITLS